jgi:hypothetical protein
MNSISKHYSILKTEPISIDMPENNNHEASKFNHPAQILPFQRIWTTNVVFTLIMTAFFDFHLGYISSIYFMLRPITPFPLSNSCHVHN